MSPHERAARVKLILLDVDGVLTDGSVLVHADGTESKPFAIRDGIALVWAQRVGVKVGLLSARHSPTTPHRAAQLGITLIYQGVKSKADAYAKITSALRVADDDVAYMGDDVVDLAVLSRVGLAAAPADAVEEVRCRAHWVSRYPGGRGAVRELVETILRAQQQWDRIVSSYLNEGAEA
ncbi:MAG: HAD-IIIA family hydrolase [Acidimicrobiia bacterium]|nr:HAD-IIIA family hydrolase [Acidimicrobiia bacterium]